MKLPFESGAADEFDAAATWYERERTGYATSFTSAVRGGVDRAARFPQSATLADTTEQEMKIITANFEYCGYEFYVFQKLSAVLAETAS